MTDLNLISDIKLRIKRSYFSSEVEILAFKLEAKSEEEKRSSYDSSKWLKVVYEKDGQIKKAKFSHNNNQALNFKDITVWRSEKWESLRRSGIKEPGEHQKQLSEESKEEKSTTTLQSEDLLREKNSKKNTMLIQHSENDITKNQKIITTLIKSRKTEEEQKTSERMGIKPMSTTETITQPMVKECESKLKTPNTEEIQPLALPQQSITFVKEELELMNCVDSCNAHLMALMKGLTHDKPPADIQRVESHIADTAANVASRITENLKVKLACIRTVREFR